MSALLDAVNTVLAERVRDLLANAGYDWETDMPTAMREALVASRIGPDHPIMEAVYAALHGDESYDHVTQARDRVLAARGSGEAE